MDEKFGDWKEMLNEVSVSLDRTFKEFEKEFEKSWKDYEKAVEESYNEFK